MEEEVLQVVQSTAQALRLKLVTAVEGEAGSPALEVEEGRCLLPEAGGLAENSKEEVRELLNLARSASLAARVAEQHLRGE